MTWSPAKRREVLSRLPFVQLLKTPVRCEGYRWGQIPLKAIHPWGPKRANPPTGREQYRCKNNGYWKFSPLQRSMAVAGTFCMSHLFSSGIYHDMDEHARTEKAVEKVLAEMEKEKEAEQS